MSIARAVAANTIVQIVGKVISTGIGLVVAGMMMRLLGQAGFGAYSTANSFLQVFAIILDMGLNVMVVQMLGERAGDKKFEDRAVSAVFSLRFWSALILLTIAPIIGLFTGYSHEIKVAFFAIWASFFFTALNQIVIGVQQRHLKAHIIAISEVAGRLTLLAGVIAGTMLHWGLIPIILIVSLGSTVNFFVNFLVARKYASFKIVIDWEFWKMTLLRSWPIGVSIFFTLIYYKSDILILSVVRPLEEVGIYGAAYRVLEILATFPFMYAGVLLPIIANAWAKKNKPYFQLLIQRSADAFAVITFPIVAGGILIADKAILLIGGSDFAESANILRVLMIAVGCIYIGTIFSHAIVALDLQRRMLKEYILVAIVTLVLYIIFIPIYGMWAAAFLTVFSEAWIAIITYRLSTQFSEMNFEWTTTWKAFLSALLMFAIAYPFSERSLILTILLSVVTYTIAIFATGAVTKGMIQDLLIVRKGTPVIDEMS